MRVTDRLKHTAGRAGAAVGLVLTSGAAMAQSGGGIDVSAATDTLTSDGGTAIAAVGAALIGLAAIAVTYKWVKASIFG